MNNTFPEDYPEYNSSFVQESFYFHFGLDQEEIERYVSGKEALDIGAGSGDSALLFIKQFNASRVVSVDPSDYSGLEFNTNIQQLERKDDVELLHVAADDHDSKVPRGFSDEGIETQMFSNGSDTVNTKRIDTIVSNFNLTRVGLIKIDANGFGFRALRGAEQTINKFSPVLVLAMHNNPEEYFEQLNWLGEKGYDSRYKFEIKRNYIGTEGVIGIYLVGIPPGSKTPEAKREL